MHDMNAQKEVTAQVRDLLTYFPGRGRLTLVWLVILPLISPLLFSSHYFGRIAPSSTGIPYAVFVLAGLSAHWFYLPTMLFC